jgi:hypothetical protein
VVSMGFSSYLFWLSLGYVWLVASGMSIIIRPFRGVYDRACGVAQCAAQYDVRRTLYARDAFGNVWARHRMTTLGDVGCLVHNVVDVYVVGYLTWSVMSRLTLLGLVLVA